MALDDVSAPAFSVARSAPPRRCRASRAAHRWPGALHCTPVPNTLPANRCLTSSAVSDLASTRAAALRSGCTERQVHSVAGAHFDWSGLLGASMAMSLFSDRQLIEIRIPSGIQSGKQIRQRGAGMPVLNGRGHGDLVIQIDVETPTRLSAKQKELLEQFRETETGEECPQSSGFFTRLKGMFGE